MRAADARPALFRGRRRWIAGTAVFAFLLLLLGKGGKTPAAWIPASLILLGSWIFLLWKEEDPALRKGLPLCVGVFMVLQGLSALGAPCWPLAAKSLVKIWTAAAFGALLFTLPLEECRRWTRKILLGVALICGGLAWAGHGWGPLFPGNPQYDALWLVCGFLVALEDALADRRASPRPRLPGLLAVFLGASLFLAHSRAGLLAGLAGLGVQAAFGGGRRRWIFLAVLLLLAALPGRWWNTLSRAGNSREWKRVDIWKASLWAAADRPFLGWGPGHFESAYRSHAPPQDEEPARFEMTTAFAHNDGLQVAVETGIPSAVFLLFLVVVWGGVAAGESGCLWRSLLAALGVVSFVNFPWVLPINGLLLAAALRCAGPLPTGRRWSVPAFAARGLRLFFFAGAAIVGAAQIALAVRALSPEAPEDVLQGIDVDKPTRAVEAPSAGGPEEAVRAEAILSRAVDVCPACPEFFRERAHIRSGHFNPPHLQSAAADLSLAAEREPGHAPTYLEWADLSERMGDRASALAAAHRALRLEPAYGAAALALGRLLRSAGRPADAARWLEGWRVRQNRSAEMGAAPSGYRRTVLTVDAAAFALEEIRCKIDQKKYNDALGRLSSLGESGGPDRWVLEARVHFLTGRFDLSEDRLKKALAAGGPNPRLLGLLDVVRHKRNAP